MGVAAVTEVALILTKSHFLKLGVELYLRDLKLSFTQPSAASGASAQQAKNALLHTWLQSLSSYITETYSSFYFP